MEPVFHFAEKYKLPEKTIPAHTLLLNEGEQARQLYFIRKGCLRMGLHHKGNVMTHQFFFENSMVASLESFLTGQPSSYFLDALEACQVYVLEKDSFDERMNTDPEFKNWFQDYILKRFIFYSRHMLSLLKDKPEERYRQLCKEQPHLLQRVPQHFIASYLGMTPVSLSRIRNKIIRDEKEKDS